MTNILLDTTYVLPLFGIDLGEKLEKELREFFKNGRKEDKIFLSESSLLEVLYKLNREYRKQKKKVILDRYPLVFPSILNFEFLTLVNSILDPQIIENANVLRRSGHTDFLDCIIAGTALKLGSTLVTEDRELISKLKQVEEFESLKTSSWKNYWQEMT